MFNSSTALKISLANVSSKLEREYREKFAIELEKELQIHGWSLVPCNKPVIPKYTQQQLRIVRDGLDALYSGTTADKLYQFLHDFWQAGQYCGLVTEQLVAEIISLHEHGIRV